VATVFSNPVDELCILSLSCLNINVKKTQLGVNATAQNKRSIGGLNLDCLEQAVAFHCLNDHFILCVVECNARHIVYCDKLLVKVGTLIPIHAVDRTGLDFSRLFCLRVKRRFIINNGLFALDGHIALVNDGTLVVVDCDVVLAIFQLVVLYFQTLHFFFGSLGGWFLGFYHYLNY
jgi:hypothetical protein